MKTRRNEKMSKVMENIERCIKVSQHCQYIAYDRGVDPLNISTWDSHYMSGMAYISVLGFYDDESIRITGKKSGIVYLSTHGRRIIDRGVASACLIDECEITIERGCIVKIRRGLEDLPIQEYINSDDTIKKFPEGWENLPDMKRRTNAAIKVLIENTRYIPSKRGFDVPYRVYKDEV